MNIQQRLTKLEQATAPAKDDREPTLVRFIGYGDEPTERAAILMVYRNGACDSHNLSTQELADYEASGLPAEQWLNTVPRPIAGIEQAVNV